MLLGDEVVLWAGMEPWDAGGVAAGGVAVCAKAGAARTVASATAVKVRFIMENPPRGEIFEIGNTDKRRFDAA
jgi:hypothetical protein